MLHRFGSASDFVESGLSHTYQDSRTDDLRDNPLYKAQDPESRDIAVVLKIVGEMIRINGANVKFHPRTRNEDIDGVWDEDADPTYWPSKHLSGFFVPQPMEFELTEWGVDTKNQTEVVFAKEDVLNKLERTPAPGDIVELPYGSLSLHKPKYYRVNNAQETGNFRYIWLYVTCQVELITGDITIRPPSDNALPINDYPDPDMLDEAV
jgi:hypothetical protein